MKKASGIVILLFVFVSIVSAQGYTLSISPGSGAPGTIVTLSPNPTYTDERCFANGAPTGRSYAVPTGAVDPITFHCEAGSGEFAVRTNDAVFFVIPADTDGDGIPDSQDACPNQSAPNTPNGCPPGSNPPPNQPVQPQPVPNQPQPLPQDSDGDGLPDGQDQCPNLAGSESTGGCPLPDIPQDGECMAASSGAFNVNVRESFSGLSDVIGQLSPLVLYQVRAKVTIPPEDAETGEHLNIDVSAFETWYLLNDGWVASWVTRTGGDCDSVPDVYQPIGGETLGDPPEVCQGTLTVVFEGFNPDDTAEIVESVRSRLNFPDVVVSGNTYIGTPCKETIFGTPGTDLIIGNGGNDNIYGFGGNDIIAGGDGDDLIYGGQGNDTIIGNSGNDHLYGNVPSVFVTGALYSGGDNDRIYGSDGNDFLYGGVGNDWLFGEAGNDRLFGDRQNDRLFGGLGDDHLRSGYGSDLVLGGEGNDAIHAARNGYDIVRGGPGNDSILYSEDPFTSRSGTEPDNFDPRTVIEGNEGNDGITVDGVSRRLPSNRGVYSGYERYEMITVYGNEGNDILNGDFVILHGGDGNDMFNLMGGSLPGASRIVAYGEAGDDAFNITAHYTMYALIFGGDGNDSFRGGIGRDVFYGGNGNDIAQGMGEVDILYGENGNDQLYGFTPFFIPNSFTASYPNYLDGGTGADTMIGGPSNYDFCLTGSGERDSTLHCESMSSRVEEYISQLDENTLWSAGLIDAP